MKLYSVKEVADILDMNPETIKRYIHREELKAYKVGREWRIKVSDLEEFVFSESNIKESETNES